MIAMKLFATPTAPIVRSQSHALFQRAFQPPEGFIYFLGKDGPYLIDIDSYYMGWFNLPERFYQNDSNGRIAVTPPTCNYNSLPKTKWLGPAYMDGSPTA